MKHGVPSFAPALALALTFAAAACGDDVPDVTALDDPLEGGAPTSTGAATDGPSNTGDSGDPDPIEIDEVEGCDPMIPEVCGFPWPSLAWSGDGTGLALTEQAMPQNASDAEALAAWSNDFDGISRAAAFVTLFPDQTVDTANLPTAADPEASLSPDAPVLLIDVDTGERYAAWAETDVRGEGPSQQPFIVRPAQGLPFGARIAAVVTDAVVDTDGEPLRSPVAFAALRDGMTTTSPSIEARREAMESLFARLQDEGVARESVVMAWMGRVQSEGSAQGLLPAMVSVAAQAMDEARTIEVDVNECYVSDAREAADLECDVDGGMNPRTWRRLIGTVQLPNFLDADGLVQLDADGMPMLQGTASADFVMNVPMSLRTAAPQTAPLITFGHGLLASPHRYIADDTDGDGQVVLSDLMSAVFVGTRWRGLTGTDLAVALGTLSDANGVVAARDLLAQGIVNQIMMVPFVRKGLADDARLQTLDAAGPILHPEHQGYTGISLGGIFGTVYMALSPYVRTGVLHVPSSGFVHLLPHSGEFTPFQNLLDGSVPDPNEQQLFFALLQRMFDVGDPINYIQHIEDAPVTDLGTKHCLWQCSVGDIQAPWFGCDALVRAGGFPQVGPVAREVPLLDTIDSPTRPGTSGLQYFDPQLGTPLVSTDSVEDNGAHKALRRNPEVHQQTRDYLDPTLPGAIVNHCGGACVIDPVPR